jgi:hypothetical protein
VRAAGFASTTRPNGVHHEHPVAQAVHDHVARDPGEGEQAALEQPLHEDPAHQDEQERRQVHRSEQADLEDEQHVGHPRQHRGDRQHDGQPRVDPAGPQQPADERDRGHHHHHVRVDGVDHEERSDVDHGELLADLLRRQGAEEVVRRRDGQDQQDERRLHAEQQQRPARHPGPSPGEEQDEHEPQRRDQHDADVLEVSPQDPGARVVDRQLHRAREAPPGGCQQQRRQGAARHGSAAPGHGQREPGEQHPAHHQQPRDHLHHRAMVSCSERDVSVTDNNQPVGSCRLPCDPDPSHGRGPTEPPGPLTCSSTTTEARTRWSGPLTSV